MFSPIPKLLKIPDPDPDPDPGSPIPITRLIDRVIGLDRADRAIPINDRGRSGVNLTFALSKIAFFPAARSMMIIWETKRIEAGP